VTSQPAVAPPPGNPRFPLIDALRAIAALSIFVLHADVTFSGGSHAWYRSYFSRLDIGVTVFFLISGFLLYRPFVAARRHRAPRPSVIDYARARALRILPAYWLALTLLAIYPGLSQVFDHDGWRYYLLLQQYFPHFTYGGLSQAWSLCVEVSFYALLPLLALVASRLELGRARSTWLRRELLVLAALYAASVAFRLVVSGGGTPHYLGIPAHYTLVPGSAVAALPGTLDWFALGMALAVGSVALQERERMPQAVALVERLPTLCWAAALALFAGSIAIGVFPRYPDTFSPGQWYAGQAIYGLVALLLLLPAVFGDRRGGLPRRVMSDPMLGWLGVVSYGVFLWHVPILHKLGQRGPGPLQHAPGLLLATLGLGLTIACAAASYYAFERPLLRLKHRRVWTRGPAEVPAGLGTAARSD
jgi:peptidoglycan/LPS O-acetylase OafA/YrhL